MNKKIFIGGLPFSATEEQVRELVAPYGNAQSIAMINDRETGKFRGFCFVEMDSESASATIKALDGTTYSGRTLRVNEARPQEERAPRRNFSSAPRSFGDRERSGGGFNRGGSSRGNDKRPRSGGW